MVGLVLLSLPFLALGCWLGHAWTLAIPFVFWIGFASLEAAGILPGETSLAAALLAGAFGALFTGLGLVLHPVLRRRAA